MGVRKRGRDLTKEKVEGGKRGKGKQGHKRTYQFVSSQGKGKRMKKGIH